MSEETPVNPVQDERDAIARIALTADGKLFHRYLRRVLEAVMITESSGALQAHTGRRTLAADIMRLMVSGIEANRDRPSGPDDSILASAGRAVAVTRSAASGARRGADAHGWGDDNPDAVTHASTAGKRAT